MRFELDFIACNSLYKGINDFPQGIHAVNQQQLNLVFVCQIPDPKDDVLRAKLHWVQKLLEMCRNNHFAVHLFLGIDFLRLFSASLGATFSREVFHDGQGIPPSILLAVCLPVYPLMTLLLGPVAPLLPQPVPQADPPGFVLHFAGAYMGHRPCSPSLVLLAF